MARVTVYRTYRWKDKDHIIDAIRTCVEDEGLSLAQVKDLCGVTVLHNWFHGDTRKPNNATVCAVSNALGYARQDTLDKDGNLTIRFVKQREWDYRDEYEAQANWVLKYGTAKQKEATKKSLAANRKFPKKNGKGS